jgi:hypothetical protein
MEGQRSEHKIMFMNCKQNQQIVNARPRLAAVFLNEDTERVALQYEVGGISSIALKV